MKLSDFIGEATEYDKKELLEERKPKSWLKSVSAFANGIGGTLFFGVSNDETLNESVPASAADLNRLVLRGSNTSFDSLSSRYPFESLAFTKLRSVYRMRTGMELTDSDFVSFELVDENNMLTNAGALLADESPLRHSRLFCTRWYLFCKTVQSLLRTTPKSVGKRQGMGVWKCLNIPNRRYTRLLIPIMLHPNAAIL